jgi:HEAT repeat protein
MTETTAQTGPASPYTAETAAAAERVLKATARLVNGRKIYADNNPRLGQFRQELETTLRQFFEFEDELVLTIEQYAMRLGEHVVYENTRRDESLAFILFKDGIGELTILPKAADAEIDRLVAILADELFHIASDEDVVTRLWNADFDHITYRVLDDYLAGEFGEGARNDGAAPGSEETADQAELLPSLSEKGRVMVDRSEELQSLDTVLRGFARRHHPALDGTDAELAYQRLLRAWFALPVGEMEVYRSQLESEHAEDGIAAFVEALCVFTMLPDNPSAVRDISSILDRLVDFAVTEKNPETLARIVRYIRAFLAEHDPPDEVKAFCVRMLGRAGSPALVAGFLDTLADADARADAVLDYAGAVGPGAVEPLVRALHRVDTPALHRRLCDALIAVAGPSLASLLDRFDVDHPEVAVDAVYIARALGMDPMTPKLRELVFYPDPRVKLEMLGWIAARADNDATDLLLSSLDDLDKRVRMRVLDALGERRSPRVRDRLTDLAFSREIAERAADEQEAIFRALGGVGDVQTVMHLRAVVERRRLLSPGRGADAKHLAIRALERIREPAALDVLARLAEDSNESIRLRAMRAKENLSAALAATPEGGAKAGVERRP